MYVWRKKNRVSEAKDMRKIYLHTKYLHLQMFKLVVAVVCANNHIKFNSLPVCAYAHSSIGPQWNCSCIWLYDVFIRLGWNPQQDLQQNVKHTFAKCWQLFKSIAEMSTILRCEDGLPLPQFNLLQHLHRHVRPSAVGREHESRWRKTPHQFSAGDLYTVPLSFIFAAIAQTTSAQAPPTNNMKIAASS